MEHAVPSSSDASSLQEHMASVRSIAEKGLEQSSILECLHGKVNELLKYREKAIALETQVKIAEEMLELQKAETAFMQEEYEKEIETLKQRGKIVVNTPRQSGIEIKLQQVESQSVQMKTKYEKWKTRAKEWRQQTRNLETQVKRLQKENETAKEDTTELRMLIKSHESEINDGREVSLKLQEETDNLSHKLHKANKAISQIEQESATLKTELQEKEVQLQTMQQKLQKAKSDAEQTKQDQKNEIEKLQTKLRDVTNEKVALEGQVRKMKAQLKGQKMEIESLSAEQTGAADSAAVALNQISQMEEENQKLRLQVKSLTLVNRRMGDTEAALKKEHDLVIHCEEEMTNICDTLGITPCQLNGEWNSICEKCSELQVIKESVDQVKAQNVKLQKRLMAVVSDRRKSNNSQPNSAMNEDDECLAGVLQSVRDLRDKLDEKDKIIKQLRYQSLFSAHIVEQYATTCQKIEALHSSVFAGPQSMSVRALFLAVIFARRMDTYRKMQAANDPTALSVFIGRLHYAPDGQLMKIGQKIIGLTNDLVDAKQKVAELTDNAKLSQSEIDTMTLQIRTNKDKAEIGAEKVKHMKQRIIELEEELATLVSTEVHDSVCAKLEQTQSEARKLKKAVLKYAKELESRDEVEQALRDRIEEVQLAAEQESARVEEISGRLLLQEKQREALELVVKEKTKEILALERLVSRQRERAAVENTSINLMAVENRTLFQKSKDEPEGALAGRINPDFL